MKKPKLQKRKLNFTPYDLLRKKKKSALKLLRKISNTKYVVLNEENN